MDEHSHSFEGHSPVSAASLSAFAQRFLVETLKSSGHEQWARWIKEWPEILGDKTGRALKNMLDKQTKGEAITPEEKHEFERALEEEPKEAATLLGLLIADVLHGTVDATEERKQILKLFNLAFDIICGYMRTATTSLALKGFIHNEKCIAY